MYTHWTIDIRYLIHTSIAMLGKGSGGNGETGKEILAYWENRSDKCMYFVMY